MEGFCSSIILLIKIKIGGTMQLRSSTDNLRHFSGSLFNVALMEIKIVVWCITTMWLFSLSKNKTLSRLFSRNQTCQEKRNKLFSRDENQNVCTVTGTGTGIFKVTCFYWQKLIEPFIEIFVSDFLVFTIESLFTITKYIILI